MKQEKKKIDVGKIFVEELANQGPKDKKQQRQSFLIPFLAIITGLVIGALFIIFTSQQVYDGFKVSIWQGFAAAGESVWNAYSNLFTGAFGSPSQIIQSIQSGDALKIRWAFYPFLESFVASTPFIFTGLALALGFRAGVLNIGAEGQVFIGATFATFIGYSLKGIPAIIHAPLALLAGAAGGALWGFIPGWLKVKTGAHEVINCIMMNYIAFRLSDYLVSGPMMRSGQTYPTSPIIEKSAELPRFFGYPIRFHLGFFIALVFAVLVWWFLFKTTWGFELRAVGTNPNAGKYSGMSVSRNIILAMALSGALAGLAGANDILGVTHYLSRSFSSGYGFDGIALALLGGNHPLGVVLAALLFGFLRNGAVNMQMNARVPIEIVSVLQGVILMFIAAPAMIRTIYRIKEEKKTLTMATATKEG